MPAICNIPYHNCYYENCEGIWWDGKKKGATTYFKNTQAFMFVEGVNKTKIRDGTLPVILESNINQYFWSVRDRNRCANLPD
jgi:hypothetical protein